jgi:hypothetical protein
MNITVTLFMVLVAVGCHQNKIGESSQQIDTTLAAKREIPLTRFSDTINAYKAMRKFEKDLQLDRLVYGYDSVQFRILFTFSLTSIRQLVIISCRNSVWKAKALDLDAIPTSDTTIKFEVTNEKSITPSSGWVTFIKQLNELGIRDLLDYSSLPGSYYNTDEKLVAIEYATSEFYKIISYPSRPDESNLAQQEIQLENIIQYLEKEFNFKGYKRPEKN